MLLEEDPRISIKCNGSAGSNKIIMIMTRAARLLGVQISANILREIVDCLSEAL